MEKISMKQSRFSSKFRKLILVMSCVLLLSACGNKLSSDFDEAEIEKATEEVIQLINNQDTEAIRAMCTVQMKTALTDEVFAQVYEIIAEGGAYDRIEDMSIAGTKDSASGEEFAMVVANAKYDIKLFTFTISFTKQMKLAGLFIK